MHSSADLQSVHGFSCYDNIHACKLKLQPYTLQMRIAPNAKCQRVLVLAFWLVCNCSTYLAYADKSPVQQAPGKLRKSLSSALLEIFVFVSNAKFCGAYDAEAIVA